MVYGNRYFPIRRKPRLILNSSFKIFNELNIGDSGFVSLNATIVEERKDDEDGSIIKTINVDDAKLIDQKNIRIR